MATNEITTLLEKAEAMTKRYNQSTLNSASGQQLEELQKDAAKTRFYVMNARGLDREQQAIANAVVEGLNKLNNAIFNTKGFEQYLSGKYKG